MVLMQPIFKHDSSTSSSHNECRYPRGEAGGACCFLSDRPLGFSPLRRCSWCWQFVMLPAQSRKDATAQKQEWDSDIKVNFLILTRMM